MFSIVCKKNIVRLTGYVLVLSSLFLFLPVSTSGLNVAFASEGWFAGLLDIIGSGAKWVVENTTFQVWKILMEWILIPLVGWFMGIAGNLLDLAINFSLDSRNLIDTGGIKIGWKIIRDFMNMGFIFVLLWIAINTILGTSGSASKKILANLVISAILINFSLFIAGLVIDATNIVALAFRNAIVVQGSDQSLSAVIAVGLKIAETYEPAGLGGTVDVLNAAVRLLTMSITIWVFLTCAILFITRTVAFVILLILSPIGFVGQILPKLKTYSDEWWENLAGQALVAPIFLFFFYILAKMISSNMFDKVSGAVAASNNPVDVSYYLNFAIIIGLLIAAKNITKKFSGKIGASAVSAVTKYGMLAAGLVGGATIGGAALVGRNVVGRGASAMLSAKNAAGETIQKRLADRAAQGGFKGFAGKIGLRGLQRAEGGSFDLRSTKPVKQGLGLAGQFGLRVPKLGKAGGKGGFSKAVEEKTKQQRKIAEEMFGGDEEAKKKYAENVLLQPAFGVFGKLDPKTPAGKLFKNVQAGGKIKEEAELKLDKKKTGDEIKANGVKIEESRENIKNAEKGVEKSNKLIETEEKLIEALKKDTDAINKEVEKISESKKNLEAQNTAIKDLAIEIANGRKGEDFSDEERQLHENYPWEVNSELQTLNKGIPLDYSHIHDSIKNEIEISNNEISKYEKELVSKEKDIENSEKKITDEKEIIGLVNALIEPEKKKISDLRGGIETKKEKIREIDEKLKKMTEKYESEKNIDSIIEKIKEKEEEKGVIRKEEEKKEEKKEP